MPLDVCGSVDAVGISAYKLENRMCRQIQDLRASFWHKTEKEAQRLFAKFHMNSLFSSRGQLELIFALRAAVSEILTDFHNCHIWA